MLGGYASQTNPSISVCELIIERQRPIISRRKMKEPLITTETPSCPCPDCDEELQRCTGPGSPDPGDVAICINCGALNVYDESLLLKRASITERKEIMDKVDRQSLKRFYGHLHSIGVSPPNWVDEAMNISLPRDQNS